MLTRLRHSTRPHQTRHRRPRAAVRATVPEDAGFYRCGCGKAFTAAVTTCVTCPACGNPQAW
jgi:hypothetical protein